MSTPGLQEGSRCESNRTASDWLSERISADERESKSTGPVRADLITDHQSDRTSMLLSLAYACASRFAKKTLATISLATIVNSSLIEWMYQGFEVQKI